MFLLKDRYDFIFSLGASCTCAEALRRCGFQYCSLPFDWASCGLPVAHAEMMVSDLGDFMRIENMEFLEANTEGNCDVYLDRANGVKYYHDFPGGVSIAESLPVVREKYIRRFKRLWRYLDLSRATLAVITTVPTRPRMTDEELRRIHRVLSERFPDAGIEVLYIYQDDGVFDPSRVVRVDEHIVKAGFDIRMPAGSNPFITNRKAIIPVLKALVPKGVVDYRTPEERRAYKIAERRKKYREMRASSCWQYWINRFCWCMFRHFRNRLERAGFTGLPSHRVVLSGSGE